MTEKYIKILEFDKIREKAVQYAVCPQAADMLRSQPPAQNPDEETELLQRTDCITSLLIKNGTPRFTGVSDVPLTVNRAQKGGVLSMAELLQVAHTLRNFRSLSDWYSSSEHDELCVDDSFFALTPQPQLEKSIYESIISESEMADTASAELADIRRKIRITENTIRDKLEHIVKSADTNKFLQESVVSLRNGRYVVPVKAEHRGEVGGVIHDVSSTGATLFVEPAAIVEANAHILQLQSQEQAEIERILARFSAAAAALEPLFTVSYNAMLEIDALLAKAHLAVEMQASMPRVTRSRSFSLIKARHPLIAKDKVVPIDITLGRDYDSLIITGPNTGGKTVTLKTAGLFCCMAMHGYLLPAHESSEVCLFRDILADIGDEQSIEQSLSTFSGHIKNIVDILQTVDNECLVLLDELGAGTDPAEGAALAVAIIEQLRHAGAKVMATTHYSELKIFALNTPGVQNASCEFDVVNLRPTYKLSVGVPGKSNAFFISERLGLRSEVISRAQEHLSAEDKTFDAMLAQLDDLKLELKQSREETEKLRSGAKTELEQAQAQREKILQQAQRELELARDKAQAMVRNVETSAYTLMDELHKLEKSEKQAAGQRAARAREIARKDAEKLFAAADIVHNPPRDFTPLKSVRIGQEAEVAELGKIAVVTALPDKNGLVAVRMGALKTKVPLSGLCAPQKQQKPKPQPRRAGTVQSAPRQTNMEINLLGMDVEQALWETDKFIDNGVINNQNVLYLIHGNGTGALRRAIHAHLRGHKNVKSFRLGKYGEGETGVTVVELK